MNLRNNKKGFFPGWEYIAGFFLVAILFVLIVGMYDFTIVELYEPIHSELNESLHDLNATNNLAYQKFEENNTDTHNKTLPFNLLYIVMFFYSIVASLINVAKSRKMSPFDLIFKTIGGLVFFLYLMQLSIFKVVTYFKIEIVDYLFEDLILSYIPFYLYTYTNAGIVILLWGGSAILFNWYFGKKEEEFKGVFGK